MKKLFAMLMVLALVLGSAAMAEELSYDGQVVAGETVPIAAPFGGRMGEVKLRAGDPVAAGDTLAEIKTTLNYAPVEGTVTGLYVAEGDSVADVKTRYGAVMYIEPTRKYKVEATSEKAFNSSENYFIHLGERVYLTCASDGTHEGTGVVTALTETGYTVEVTGGEFYLTEKVYIYRNEKRTKESRIGTGKVKRSDPVKVETQGEGGSVLKLHVANGDFVERGELLFETVDGILDGYYAPDNTIKSPVDGVIYSVDKKPGETAAKGDTLMQLIPSKSFQVEFDVQEADLFLLKVGQPVTMELYWDNAAEKTYKGEIVAISHMNVEPAANAEQTSTKKIYKAYASFEADDRIRLGMSMQIYLTDNTEDKTEEPEE